jgi:hypothetical protein
MQSTPPMKLVPKMMSFRNGILQKLRMVTSSTWLRGMALSCGGVTTTDILIANSFFHKPTEHDAWDQRKNEYNKRKGKGKSNADIKTPASPSFTTPVA